MPTFLTTEAARVWMATHEGTQRAMAEDIGLDWKARVQEAAEIDQEIAKAQRHNKLLADVRPALASRALEVHEALGDLDNAKTVLERSNEALQIDHTRLETALIAKRAAYQQEIATLEQKLREAKQVHVSAVTESNDAREMALAADQATVAASRQDVADTLTTHATQKNEADVAHAAILRGHAIEEDTAKQAAAAATRLRAELTALRK